MKNIRLWMCAVVVAVVCGALLFTCFGNDDSPAAVVSPTDDSSQFVTLTDAVPDAILEIRYFGTYNFVGQRIDGYLEPTALLTKVAADSLRAVSDDVKRQGYRLKIYDAYRPQKGVDHFVRWAADLSATQMKQYFYPDLDKSVLFEQEYIYEKSGHTRGSTVDLTLFDMATEKELDMGGTFDWFGPESHPDFCGNPETGEYTGDNSKSPQGPQHHCRAVCPPHDSPPGHARPRLQAPRQRVVALHAARRALPRHLLHLPRQAAQVIMIIQINQQCEYEDQDHQTD